MSEAEERARVVAEARTWLGTPFHHAARVKGAGVDCAMLLAEVFERAGTIARVEIENYPRDWNMHRDHARFLSEIMLRARPVPLPPRAADIVMFRYGRQPSHAAIVTRWPEIIHAYSGRGVVLDDVSKNAELAARFVGAFSVWRATA